MWSHWIAITAVSVDNLIASTLINSLQKEIPEETDLRLDIAGQSFLLTTIPLWFIVQLLMLIVIVGYGKPMESDTKVLMSKKL